jgi:hypothetical protein
VDNADNWDKEPTPVKATVTPDHAQGNLQVDVYNIPENNLPSASGTIEVKLWSGDYQTYIGSQSANFAGGEPYKSVTFSNLSAGSYTIEVFQTPNAGLLLPEFWGSNTISFTGTTTYPFQRHTQVLSYVQPQNAIYDLGTTVTPQVTAKNLETFNDGVKVRLIIDQDKAPGASGYDYDQTSGPFTVSAGGTYFFNVLPYWTPGSEGTYYFYAVAYGKYGPSADSIVTDQWGWVKAFDIERNSAPYAPSNSSPADHANGIAMDADLSWSGGDPNVGDIVTYDVYLGDSSNPPLLSDDQLGTTYDPGTQAPNTKYYWRVVATDDDGASSPGPLWDFTTGTPSPPADPAKSTIEAGPGSVRADGFSVSNITVSLKDSNGNPVPGKLVHIITEPWVIMKQLTYPTDEKGQVTGEVRSLREGSISVSAIDVTDNIVLAEHTSVVFQQVWYAFDGHVHTRYSFDCKIPPNNPTVLEQASAANAKDLDAIIITDHSPLMTDAGWWYLDYDCSSANKEPDKYPLMIPGLELGGKSEKIYTEAGVIPTGHYLAYGISSFVPSYPDDKPQEQINRVNDANGFGFIAHPYKGDVWPGKPWEYSGFAGIEILSGNDKEAQANTMTAWDELISRHLDNIKNNQPGEEGQQRWVAIANSDAHNPSDLGQNKNYVYLEGGLTKENLYSSLKKGQVVAGHGPMVTFTISLLDINGEETGKATEIGGTVVGNVGQKARLHIAWDSMGSGDLEGIYLTGSVSLLLAWGNRNIKDAQGNMGYAEGEIKLTQAGYLCLEARLAGNSGVAYTNPIFIDAKGTSAQFDMAREISDLLQPSEVKEEYCRTTASCTESIFWTDWPGSRVELTLVDPNGLVITPDSHPSNVYHEAGSTYEFYQVAEPLPGTWTMRIEGTDVLPGGETVNLKIWSRRSTKPQAEILQLATGANVSGLANISVNASDEEGISELACRIDDILLGTAVNPPYEFPWDSTSVEDGAHLITVWLTDVDGNTVGDSAQVYVINQPELQPSAEAGQDKQVIVGEKIVFDGSASEGRSGVPYTYGWNLGNGDSAMGQTVEYTYSNPGTYIVTLFMSDEKGNWSTDDLVVVVQMPATPAIPWVAVAVGVISLAALIVVLRKRGLGQRSRNV